LSRNTPGSLPLVGAVGEEPIYWLIGPTYQPPLGNSLIGDKPPMKVLSALLLHLVSIYLLD
jgi:hypothetical protein